MRARWIVIASAAVAFFATGGSAPSPAHPGNQAIAVLTVDAAGGVGLRLHFDALAYALDEDPGPLADSARMELLSRPDTALDALFAESRERFASTFTLLADQRPIDFVITSWPGTTAVREWQRDHPRHPLPMKLDMLGRARLPAGTRRVALRFPTALAEVILTADCAGHEPIALPLRTGETSPPIPVRAALADGASVDAADSPRMSTLGVLGRYVTLGFTHIVPHGLDHVLFVLGLFLLSAKFRPLLWQVTAFTVAHSITLALTMLGVVELSPRIVEPLIAAWIAFVAIENVVTSKLHTWRTALVFVFGLVHGMGFAGVLRELGLPRGQLATALVGFNVGVELGQLCVIAGAIASVGWWRDRPWYRKRVVIPASLAIAATGLFWTVQRVMGD